MGELEQERATYQIGLSTKWENFSKKEKPNGRTPNITKWANFECRWIDYQMGELEQERATYQIGLSTKWENFSRKEKLTKLD
jgi:hypothetical protein